MAPATAGPRRLPPALATRRSPSSSRDILQDHFRRNPSAATDLGIHTYDDQLEDVSQAAIAAESQAMKGFRRQLDAIDPATLTLEKQLDREQLVRAMDSGVLGLDVIKRWARDPDAYSGGITNAAYVIMKRDFAPAGERLKSLIAREKRMPASLAEARKNLENPPRVYHRDRHRADRRQHQLLQERRAGRLHGRHRQGAAGGVHEGERRRSSPRWPTTRRFSSRTCCRGRQATFALGADTYAKALAANEMIDLPLDRLLSIAEADRRKNEEAFQATAKQIDPAKPPDAVLASLQADHPPPGGAALQRRRTTLDSLRQFIVDHQIVTIPPSDPARVKETPPFMRSTTSASMDTPGPFETAKLGGVLQHDAARPAMERRRAGGLHAPVVLRLDQQRVGTRGVSGPLPPVSLCQAFPTDVRKVYRRHDQHRGLGALLRADDARRGLSRR